MFKKLSISPYWFWSSLFIVVPLLLILVFSMGVTQEGFDLTVKNYTRFMDPLYVKVLLRSFKLALEATAICLIVGYPMAMILSKVHLKYRTMAIMLLVLPMWMNFLLRTYAWITILGKNGIFNSIRAIFGLDAMTFLYTEGAVLLGMVYNFLPFMVLPIYTVLTKMDPSLLEAAEDLGANRFFTFLKVIFPLSLPGVLSGVSMVFMPAVSTFVISNLLGGGQFMLIGNLIEQQFLVVGDWNFGSAISMLLMVLILISMSFMNRFGSGAMEEGGANLW